jgi:general L-amino acid transport system permease protein
VTASSAQPARASIASQQRPPIWRNVSVLKWAIQIIVLFLVIFAFWFLASEAAGNLDSRGIPVDYEWVDGPANIQLSEGIATQPDTAGRALWSGMVTTIRLAVVGIIASTVLGLIVGLARLSNNWVANRAASVYIETIRNIPVLVQILLWFAILTALGDLSAGDDPDTPEVEGASGPIPGWFLVSKKGISLPRVFLADGFYQWAVFVLVGIIVGGIVRRRIIHRQELQGGTAPRAAVPTAIVAAFAVIGWFANPLVGFLEHVFAAIADIWGGIPEGLMQTVLSAVAIVAAFLWIRAFLESRRTPAGLAKLTDDDWFRMIFAGFAALVAVFFFWRVWPGFSSWIINSGRDFWNLAADKFGAKPDGTDRALRPLDGMKPSITTGRFSNYAPTGWTLTVFAASLLFGLVLYTASFIAEIIRGGILAVHKGQTEAASALGLSRAQSLRLVILPQAFRVIMPPLGNQYLNITKNTSLAIAVGLSDIVQVGQSVYNKNNQTLAVFGIWMAFFLTLSLTISAIVNFINGRLAIVER